MTKLGPQNKGRQLSKDFWEYEFACKHCGVMTIHPGFVEVLQFVRDEVHSKTARGMRVTSGCRCLYWNAHPSVKGHKTSLHICDIPQHEGQKGTLGVDIAAVDGFYRGVLFSVAWGVGFSIGWNATRGFLHLDRRDWLGKPQSTFNY
jgi:hypothetical protein